MSARYDDECKDQEQEPLLCVHGGRCRTALVALVLSLTCARAGTRRKGRKKSPPSLSLASCLRRPTPDRPTPMTPRPTAAASARAAKVAKVKLS